MSARATVWLVALLAVALVPGATAQADESPVDRSRQATARLDFTGDVRVQWLDEVGHHETVLTVSVIDGVISVRGPRTVVADRRQRFVQEGSGVWRLVWQEAVPSVRIPVPAAAYQVAYGFGPVVAGRLTRLVQVAKDGVLRERLLVDAGSGLILRREQYDTRGALRRVIAFERIQHRAGSVPHPVRVRDDAPRRAVSPPSGVFRAPVRLAGGYVRIGTYRYNGGFHVVYSDGVYGLSLFERRGRLPSGYLAHAGRPIAVGRATGWHVVTPSGDVVVWQAGEAVYTVVGEAPAEEVLAAARSVPWTQGPTLTERARRALRALFDM